MANVLIDLSMSLDGFITGPNPTKEQALGLGKGEKLHEWYFSGDTSSPHNDEFKPSEGSAAVVEDMFTTTGAIVVGRSWYDIMHGWEGNHPVHGASIFVVTHEIPDDIPQGESPLIFVTDGIESAVRQAQAAAGDKDVTVGGANIAQQCLKAGLVDEIQIHLIPLLLGDGVRLFEHLGTDPIEMEIIEVINAAGVTHLRYRVIK